METKLIEATQMVENGPNHGKFLVGRFRGEWAARSELDAAFMLGAPAQPLLSRCGWTHEHLLVVDLATGEGAIFSPGGSAAADLEKHKVWVCPLFEPFLEWLYAQDLRDLGRLPSLVELPDAAFALAGHRRSGAHA